MNGHQMTTMWCDNHKRRIFLQSCISCDCKLRCKCSAYASIDAQQEAAAIDDVLAHKHRVSVSPMPLLSFHP